ncbi:hypothetical protein HBI56_169280 [Parastagonospora nodorum]|uniref:Uncharacterized protein n=1 Tax=Phaeosphaeria nodorum (strain SN15 / ATCC MYA-4574 / FGSC 10173) TaxID=321614 RepID=A0A7U2FB08_PHANO|nr:hypothetical protein HBH56_049470 [Parastagonospora nodorum]QRD01995.1 hypothetical protein JI435_417410 [Parastagonospora nodorum SN15]KAH3935836.1 hypothetical protein HBH54_035260 [Parastagonospora nodorum]KAH3942749.1 hypothetical protein HBH53_184710 [Parastagonospora nodorum]KAH3964227.1 hypothetical protein HBH51_161110 [Parastagonospora nodorum]
MHGSTAFSVTCRLYLERHTVLCKVRTYVALMSQVFSTPMLAYDGASNTDDFLIWHISRYPAPSYETQAKRSWQFFS